MQRLLKMGEKKLQNALLFQWLKVSRDAEQTEQVELIICNSEKGNQVSYLEDIT